MKKFYFLAMSAIFALNVFAADPVQLFVADPVASLGAQDYSVATWPSLAGVDGKLVFCEGDGTTPVYADGKTGVKGGEIVLGDAVAGSITNDEAGNMLIVNKAQGHETVNIYRTNSVTATPTLYYSFENPSSFPCGSRIKVNGDIDGKAVILLQADGVPGVSEGYTVLVLSVVNGAVADVTDQSLYAAGISWGTNSSQAVGLASYSNDAADGLFSSKYYQSGTFCYVTSTGVTGNFANDTSGWGLCANNLDSKEMNGHKFLTLGVGSHFPTWGLGPEIYLYDVTDMSKFVGTNVTDLECLVYSVDFEAWSNTMDGNGTAAGDIVLVPVKSENKMYLYFVDHNSQFICGYSCDVSASSGVENIIENAAPVEYYNLQGVRVANPENGIFIRKQGANTTKVVL